MITYIFMRLLNISITAGWIVLAVILARLLLKKAPKWISCLLWAVVGIRLILPFSIESVLSLIPSANTVEPDILLAYKPMVNTGFDSVNSMVNPIISSAFAPEMGASVNPLQIWGAVAAMVWVIGIFAMLVYTLITYIRLRVRVLSAVRLCENIYQSERVTSPFILGVFRPRIYMPFGEVSEHIIAHEKAHLKRGDHFIKPIAFVLLAVYWFNPLMWVAYILLCRDIELACDEKVIKAMEAEEKQEYSRTLLEFSIKRHSIAACPLAFGEVGVKSRVKSIMNYKKPAFWIIIAALVICIVVSVCFLTDPVDKNDSQIPEASDTDTEDVIDPVGIDLGFGENVERVVLISPYNEITVVLTDEIAYIRERVSQLVISDSALSLDRSEDRPSNFCMTVYYNDTRYVNINLNNTMEEIWVDDLVKPSLTYKIENPDIVKEIFMHGYTDAVAMPSVDIEAEILRRNSNAYNKGDAGVCVYRELITEGEEGKITVYLWVLYGEYVRNVDNTVEWISGGSGPVRMKFEGDEELGYYCTDYYAPDKGIYETFPRLALDAIDELDIDGMRAELDQKAEQRLTGVSYVYKDSDMALKSGSLYLWGKDNFQFTYSMLSSNLCMGKYTKADGKLILREDGCDNVYTFIINDKDTDSLTFDADNSTPLPKYKYGTNAQPEVCIPDGAVFDAVYDLYGDVYSFPVLGDGGENVIAQYYAGEAVETEKDVLGRSAVLLCKDNYMALRLYLDSDDGKDLFYLQGTYITEDDKLIFRVIGAGEYVFDIDGETLIYNEKESTYTRSSLNDKTAFRFWKGEAEEEGVTYTLTVNEAEITDNKVYVPFGDVTLSLVQLIGDDVAYKRVEGNYLSTPMNKTILNIDYPYEEGGRDGTVVTSMDYHLKDVPVGQIINVTITEELKDRLGLTSDVIEIVAVNSLIYSEEDITSAIDLIKDEVKREWQACTLNYIHYSGDKMTAEYQDWADRNDADEVIVLLSSFDVDSTGGDGSLNPNSTYDNWMWILVRTDGGTWQHVDHGY